MVFWAERLSGFGTKAFAAHEARDAVLRAGETLQAELAGHARAAVGASVAVGVDEFDGLKKGWIFLLTLAHRAMLGGIEATGRDSESVAKLGNGIFSSHSSDQRIPLCGSSDSILGLGAFG